MSVVQASSYKDTERELATHLNSRQSYRVGLRHQISVRTEDPIDPCPSVTHRSFVSSMKSGSVFDRLAINETISSSLKKRRIPSPRITCRRSRAQPTIGVHKPACANTLYERLAAAETFASVSRKMASNTKADSYSARLSKKSPGSYLMSYNHLVQNVKAFRFINVQKDSSVRCHSLSGQNDHGSGYTEYRHYY